MQVAGPVIDDGDAHRAASGLGKQADHAGAGGGVGSGGGGEAAAARPRRFRAPPGSKKRRSASSQIVGDDDAAVAPAAAQQGPAPQLAASMPIRNAISRYTPTAHADAMPSRAGRIPAPRRRPHRRPAPATAGARSSTAGRTGSAQSEAVAHEYGPVGAVGRGCGCGRRLIDRIGWHGVIPGFSMQAAKDEARAIAAESAQPPSDPLVEGTSPWPRADRSRPPPAAPARVP